MDSVLVAMSGGVDSSVAAQLVMEQGFNCSGAMMRLFVDTCRADNSGTVEASSTVGSPLEDSAEKDARAAARTLGIPFYVYDLTEPFFAEVVTRFISSYKNGSTPNPCVDCNQHIKFGSFLAIAAESGFDCIATGHYARIESDNGRFLLKTGLDESKDQSYMLYMLKQEQLSHAILPLGNLKKKDVREIALSQGFANADKRDSQDICFLPGGDYTGFLERSGGVARNPGRIIDTDGNDLGAHEGYYHYTIGQRRGLNISASQAMYVCSIDPVCNSVTVGAEESLYSKSLTAREINLIPAEMLSEPMRVTAKVRYRHSAQPATVWQLDEYTLHVEFDEPQRAITKGQSVVLYDGDVVVGGGKIS